MSYLDDKYLDPKTNDFLPQPEETAPDPHPERAGLDPEARAIVELVDLSCSLEHPALVPFMTVEEMEKMAAGAPSSEDIAAAFPGQNEIVLGGLTLTRMVSGIYTVDSRPLAELPLADLARIREAVQARRDR